MPPNPPVPCIRNVSAPSTTTNSIFPPGGKERDGMGWDEMNGMHVNIKSWILNLSHHPTFAPAKERGSKTNEAPIITTLYYFPPTLNPHPLPRIIDPLNPVAASLKKEQQLVQGRGEKRNFFSCSFWTSSFRVCTASWGKIKKKGAKKKFLICTANLPLFFSLFLGGKGFSFLHQESPSKFHINCKDCHAKDDLNLIFFLQLYCLHLYSF